MFIEVQHVDKIYQIGEIQFKALDDASFSIEKGQVGVILGPSGSGKSTLLNVIGGIDNSDSGTVKVNGIEITNYNANQLTEYRRTSVGYIFQFYNLVPNLTVYENVEVAANISDHPIPTMEMLEAVGMEKLASRFPRELSGGQQQRVSIARALVKRPEILFCDEPTGALDYESAKEILQLLAQVNEKFKTTVLIITHNTAIAGMAHRIIHLRSGQVVEDQVNSNIIPAERIEW